MILLPSASGLRVDGNRLTFDGKPVTLRGVCVGDVRLARTARRRGDYRTIARDWKANCVRIGVAPVSWRRNPERTLAALGADVAAALAQGMFVIIDWHAIGWPDGYTQLSDGSKALYDSDFALATSFWRRCAATYRGDGRVAFQLWCEPVFQRQEWRTRRGSTWMALRPFFLRMTETVRTAGAPNLLLATGTNWAYDLKGIREDLLPDANTAYEWHVYGDPVEVDEAHWERATDGLERVKPVVVTEWGFQEATDEHFKGTAEGFGKPFLRFMDERGMGWTAWCWNPEWTPNMLRDDWRTPTPFGAFVKAALAARDSRPPTTAPAVRAT